jgi:hypothetical protein
MFPIFKTGQLGLDSPEAKRFESEFKLMEADLKTDWQKRVSGDGIYVGYRVLRDFYKGAQWTFQKLSGKARTYNYLATVVENYTAFLTNEPPQNTGVAKRVDDPMERALAEARTKILDAIHEQNSLPLVFQRGGRTGSLFGDTFIYGPIPEFDVDDNGNKNFVGIKYTNEDNPESILPIWKDDNFTELDGFVKIVRVSMAKAERLVGEDMKRLGIKLQADPGWEKSTGNIFQTNQKMVTFRMYWTGEEYALFLGEGNRMIDYAKHDFGFIPLKFIPNIHLPGEPRGTSDIENELDAQQEYNERTTDLGDLIKELAKPTYWGKNIDAITEIRSGETVIYQLGDDAELNAMPRSGEVFPVEKYTQERKQDIVQLSGMNNVLYPQSNVMQATGRALSVIMQGVNNKISLRKEWWVKALKELNEQSLRLMEIYMPESRPIIGGWYATDVFISSVLVRSVSDELNKFAQKTQSLTTTMHNIGIPNPSEEQKLMKEELADPVLAIEISRQPGMQMQQGATNQTPMITTEEDREEEMAMAAAGQASPVSAEGAIAQRNQRAGQPNRVAPTKK